MLPLIGHSHKGLFDNHGRMLLIRGIKFDHDHLKLYDPFDVGWLLLTMPVRDQIIEELSE